MSGPTLARLIHTLSKFHCLLHKLYLINHHSPQERAIYGTSRLLLPFLHPTTWLFSNLRSTNLILSPSLLSLSLPSSFLSSGQISLQKASSLFIQRLWSCAFRMTANVYFGELPTSEKLAIAYCCHEFTYDRGKIYTQRHTLETKATLIWS